MEELGRHKAIHYLAILTNAGLYICVYVYAFVINSELFSLQKNGISVPFVPVEVRDFSSSWILTKVMKNPGKEKESLLDDSTWGANKGEAKSAEVELTASGLFSSLSQMWNGGSDVKAKAASNDTIHVFSLASGHLYERLV